MTRVVIDDTWVRIFDVDILWMDDSDATEADVAGGMDSEDDVDSIAGVVVWTKFLLRKVKNDFGVEK